MQSVGCGLSDGDDTSCNLMKMIIQFVNLSNINKKKNK